MARRFLSLLSIATLSAALASFVAPSPSAQSSLPSGPSGPTQQLVVRGYPAVGAPPVITVLARGAAPRKPLRYVVPVNQSGRMNLTMSGHKG